MVWEMSVGVQREILSNAHRFGWKAMPLALEDLDSNCRFVSRQVIATLEFVS